MLYGISRTRNPHRHYVHSSLAACCFGAIETSHVQSISVCYCMVMLLRKSSQRFAETLEDFSDQILNSHSACEPSWKDIFWTIWAGPIGKWSNWKDIFRVKCLERQLQGKKLRSNWLRAAASTLWNQKIFQFSTSIIQTDNSSEELKKIAIVSLTKNYRR